MKTENVVEHMSKFYQKIQNISDNELKEYGKEIHYLNKNGEWSKNSKTVLLFRELASNTDCGTGEAMMIVKSAIMDEILKRYISK